MDRDAALERLGLTGNEDASGVTRTYGRRLAQTQGLLAAAQSDDERSRHQSTLSGLIEAFEFLTDPGRLARPGTSESDATLLRDSASTPPPLSAQDSDVRMDTGGLLSGRLEIGSMLGQGGMGYVYAAHDRLRNEDVAIKVLRQDLISSTEAKERFLAEAKLSSNLSHPNIVRVYDVGESSGHYYLSMEQLHGHTLRHRIEANSRGDHAFSVGEVTEIARQLIDALRYAHRFIVHRDLKPENIWLGDDGSVKLMDFGIARAFTSSHMTQTGMMMGTAYYMAPEQRLDAKEADWRADQYALGVVLYELLSGTIPMGAVKPLEQVRRDVPQRYGRAVMRAMSPKPADRWPSLAELLAELEPRKARGKAALWLVLSVGIAAAAAGGAYLWKDLNKVPQVASAPPPASKPPDEAPAAQVLPPLAEPQLQPQTDKASAPPPVSVPPEEKGTHKPVPAQADAPVRVAAVSEGLSDTRRAECIAQCERDDGQCRSINSRGRQDCMRAVGFGATGGAGGLTIAPGSQDSACAFFTEDRCRLAPDRDECLQRTRTRQVQCVTVRSGSFASGVQGCNVASREGENMCLAQLRECRTYCN